MAKIISIFERETAFLFNANPDRAVRLVSDMPTKYRLAALAWMRGDDLRQLMSRATYFRTVSLMGINRHPLVRSSLENRT